MKKIEFTNRALDQIKKIINSDQSKNFFRITVKGGGCSGFKYDFSFDDKVNSEDVVFENTIIDKEMSQKICKCNVQKVYNCT